MFRWLRSSKHAEDELISQDTANQSYYVLLILSAVISGFGILAGSETVELGAMLISPLMVPIAAMGVGVAEGRAKPLTAALLHLSMSIFAVVIVGLAVGFIIPFAGIPDLSIVRAQPNILDLFIALAAGAVGMYGLLRHDVSTRLAGVAAAVSLEPPLVVVGLSMAKGSWPVALGASALFLTNVVAIVAAAAVVLFLMGKRPHGGTQRKLAVASWAMTGVLMVILALLLVNSFWQVTQEQFLERRMKAYLMTQVDPLDGRVTEFALVSRQDQYELNIELELPEGQTEPDWEDLAQQLRAMSPRPVEVRFAAQPTWRRVLP